jgi:hypothetical protein
MALTTGRPAVVIGLIDGPVALDHPAVIRENVRELTGVTGAACVQATTAACAHGCDPQILHRHSAS